MCCPTPGQWDVCSLGTQGGDGDDDDDDDDGDDDDGGEVLMGEGRKEGIRWNPVAAN